MIRRLLSTRGREGRACKSTVTSLGPSQPHLWRDRSDWRGPQGRDGLVKPARRRTESQVLPLIERLNALTCRASNLRRNLVRGKNNENRTVGQVKMWVSVPDANVKEGGAQFT